MLVVVIRENFFFIIIRFAKYLTVYLNFKRVSLIIIFNLLFYYSFMTTKILKTFLEYGCRI